MVLPVDYFLSVMQTKNSKGGHYNVYHHEISFLKEREFYIDQFIAINITFFSNLNNIFVSCLTVGDQRAQ